MFKIILEFPQIILVIGGDNFRFIKFSFLAFFGAKMTKIDILILKLIVPDDYQEFWVVFSTFSYFWWKMAIVVVQAKSTQKWYFLVSKPILKIFS